MTVFGTLSLFASNWMVVCLKCDACLRISGGPRSMALKHTLLSSVLGLDSALFVLLWIDQNEND